jgi:hypothetical protein
MIRLAGAAAGQARRADLRAALALTASRARSASHSRSPCRQSASWVVMVSMMFSSRSSPPRLAAVHTGDERAAAGWTARGEISAVGVRRGTRGRQWRGRRRRGPCSRRPWRGGPARSRSPTSSARSPADLAAVSYAIRHRVRSRSVMSSRVSSRSTSLRDNARARSGRGLRRASIREKSVASQPCCCQYAAADLTASRETFHVDGTRPTHCPLNQAASCPALTLSGAVHRAG